MGAPTIPLAEPVLVLGHGASGRAATMAPHVAGLRARGIDARAVDLPRGRAERAVPVFARLLAAEPGIAVGGHSFGGRVASLAAADACDAGRPPLALVLLSYPLHPPGRPDAWDDRTAHWPRITCPVLLLGGSSDPFATPALLQRALAERLPAAELVAYPRLGHGLAPVLGDVLDRIAAFVARAAGGSPGREAGHSPDEAAQDRGDVSVGRCNPQDHEQDAKGAAPGRSSYRPNTRSAPRLDARAPGDDLAGRYKDHEHHQRQDDQRRVVGREGSHGPTPGETVGAGTPWPPVD